MHLLADLDNGLDAEDSDAIFVGNRVIMLWLCKESNFGYGASSEALRFRGRQNLGKSPSLPWSFRGHFSHKPGFSCSYNHLPRLFGFYLLILMSTPKVESLC